MFDYIKRGEVGRVREVVEADPTVLALREAEDASPPLVWAARHGRVEVMEVLLELGAGLEERDVYDTALIAAAGYSQPGAVVHLLRAGADPRARGGGYNTTALHRAADRGLAECVGPLVEAGGELDAQDTGGETPLYSASEMGRVEAVRELLAHGADPSLVSSSSMV